MFQKMKKGTGISMSTTKFIFEERIMATRTKTIYEEFDEEGRLKSRTTTEIVEEENLWSMLPPEITCADDSTGSKAIDPYRVATSSSNSVPANDC